MLNRLLELMRVGSTHRVAELARKLDTTPALVEAMMGDLVRMGYLRRMGGDCHERCAGCSLACSCTAGTGGQAWVLTERGEASPGAPGVG